MPRGRPRTRSAPPPSDESEEEESEEEEESINITCHYKQTPQPYIISDSMGREPVV